MSNIEEYTKNFKFMIPEFNVATWHTEIKENFKAIDALIANFVQSQQYKGAWKQVTQYEIGDLVYISDEDSNNYGGLFKVLVDHITTGDDFDTFLGNNPTYYNLQGEMGAQVAALCAQDWAEKTDGKVVINESPVDYSSKAYAIGGVGTETNNSKYFKEQAELARDGILLDPGFIAIKNDMLGDENIKTVAENIQHVQNIDANLQSVVNVSTNIANVNTLASNIAAILTNSANISSINTNASNISDINTVSSNMSDVNNCSDNMSAIQDAPNQAQAAAQSAALAYQYGNDKINQTHITNCITHIPQDIKLELNSGTLTLKAGSKVYVPNGFEQDGTTPKFDIITLPTDTTQVSFGSNTDKYLVCVNADSNTIGCNNLSSAVSGTTPPSTGYFYNTSTNEILFYLGGSTDSKIKSLPVCIFQMTSGVITSIDKIFNGFGYIGSTVFALPGVKGLIPDDRNEDGTLNNTEFTVSSVKTFNAYVSDTELRAVVFELSGGELVSPTFAGGYVTNPVWRLYKTQDKKPVIVAEHQMWLNTIENKYYAKNNTDTDFIQYPLICIGYLGGNGSVITTFNVNNKVFRAVDYSDFITQLDEKIQLVSTLPATPTNGVLYVIPE